MKDVLYDILNKQPDKFKALCEFYHEKNKAGYGLFSCLAGETFPEDWIKAIETNTWIEDGPYGDNFRKALLK